MAAPYNPPVKGEDFIIYIMLESFANPGTWQDTPTIAAGDFQISKDGGAFANLATIPAVGPASTESVKVTLSATEMTADNVLVRAQDQTDPKEWADWGLSIPTTSA
jgi:hypothetical protein